MMPLGPSWKTPTIMRSCFRTFTTKPLSFVNRSTCLFIALVTASRSKAWLSRKFARRSCQGAP